jgi:hypothetical protein
VTKGKTKDERAPRKTEPAPKSDPNRALTAQNRKLLGKHYASKYRTRRGG